MTVAYPLKAQSDYTELKYSLRSLKYLPEITEVIIIGDTLPYWITNVTHINLPDIKGRRQVSVRRKIYAALDHADEILFMNDDIYFLQAPVIDYYHYGDLKSNQQSGSRQLQTELKAMGKPTVNFEMHMPIIFRQDFKDIMQNFSSDTLIRSAYCNYLGIEGKQMIDCKIIQKVKPEAALAFIKGRSFLSTGDHSLQIVAPLLYEMLPEKCTFEM